MTKSTILDTIGKKIIFLFEYIVNKKLSLKTEKKEKTKCPKMPHSFFRGKKKDPLIKNS